MTVVHVDAVIANAASQSNEIDLTDKVLLAIQIPAAWTAADITLLAAPKPTAENGVYVAVKAQDGTDVVFTAAAGTVVVVTDANMTKGLRFVKLRSGTPALPVNQGAARALGVALIEDDRA